LKEVVERHINISKMRLYQSEDFIDVELYDADESFSFHLNENGEIDRLTITSLGHVMDYTEPTRIDFLIDILDTKLSQ
jgi:hypothetical protein